MLTLGFAMAGVSNPVHQINKNSSSKVEIQKKDMWEMASRDQQVLTL